MEAAGSSRQIALSQSDEYSSTSNSLYWEVDDVLRNATLTNLKRTIMSANIKDSSPEPGSFASDSSPSTSGGGQQAEYWEVDDVLDAKNLANIANWTTPQNELSTSDSMEGISDGSGTSPKLKTNMVYKINSNSDMSAEQSMFAVWDGTTFVPIDPCENESESVITPNQSPCRNGTLVLSPGKKCYKLIYKSSKPTPSTLSLLREATASTVNKSLHSPASSSPNSGTKEMVGLLKKKQRHDASPPSEASIQMLPNGELGVVVESDVELESLADDEYKVCKNCGTLSKKPNVCESCGKALTDKDKTFKRDFKESKLFKIAPNVPVTDNKCSLVDKAKFYGKKLSQQWKAYSNESSEKRVKTSTTGGGVVRRGRQAASKRKTQPETVVILSDDEGYERREQHQRNHLFTNSFTCGSRTLNVNIAEPSPSALNNSDASFEEGRNDSNFEAQQEQSPLAYETRDFWDDKHPFSVPSSNKKLQGTRRDRMEDETGKIPRGRRKKVCVTKAQTADDETGVNPDITANLKARCVRLGLVKGTPIEPIIVSHEGFFIKMRFSGSSMLYDVHIPKDEIENIAVHMNFRLPVIFINPSESIGSRLREQINLTEAQFLPGSSELTLKFISLLLESCGETAEQEILMSLFLNFEKLKPHRPRFLQVLNFEEANSVLIHTSSPQNSETDISKRRHSEAAIDDTMSTDTIFVYTIPEEKGGITVTTEDVLGLKDGEFLNDVIIDFYLKYLLVEVISQEARNRTYVFSSFFYKRMILKHGKAAGKDLKIKRFESVQKWTKKIDIFSKDFVIVPINEYSHWFLAIICFPGMVTAEPNGTVQEEDNQNIDATQDNSQEEGDEAADGDQQLQNMGALQAQPCILIFDSLAGPSKAHVVRILRDYLTLEWHAKHKTNRLFDRKTMKGGYPRVPQQNNSYDCGIYLMQFMESFFERPIQNYTIPIRGLENWFPLEQVANKRQFIRELISVKEEKYNAEKSQLSLE